MRARLILPLTCAVWSVVWGSGAMARETAEFLEYLYVEPNTGGSSGGHAAICLAEACYHFQQIDGSIRLQRERPENLDFDYRVLGNRTVHVSRIAIAEGTKARLRDGFDRRLWAQERHFENLDERVRDRQLLEWLRTKSEHSLEASPLRLPGSGYFVRDHSAAGGWWSEGTPRSEALAGLARRMAAVHGADFLERRAAALRSAIAALEPSPAMGDFPAPEADTIAAAEPGFAARYRELASGLLALEILRAAPVLQSEHVLRGDDAEFRLTSREIEVLGRHAARLEAVLVRLMASARSDWADPFLIGMARLLAIEESVRSGLLVVVDVFAEDAASIPAAKVAAHARTLALVLEERHADFVRLRRAFFAEEKPGEARFSMLELAANLYVEVGRGLREEAPIRLPGASALPERSARRRDWPLPLLSPPALDGALATARRREASYRQALERLYPYDLLERNCVTELFRTIEKALVADENEASLRALAAASRRDLGGYVDWRGDLNFVPLMSQRSVRGEYRVAGTQERASYRRSALRRMYERENDLRVGLRESNVLTARTYERNEDDSLFLFFTDGVLLRRPLYGVVNLAVSLGGALAGAALLPFDRGATLRAGLNGALYSVPELALINVRKGSFAFAPRGWSGGSPPPH